MNKSLCCQLLFVRWGVTRPPVCKTGAFVQLHDSYESWTHLSGFFTTYSPDYSTKKAARVFKHISSCLCDNGPRHRQLYKRCHISLVIRSQIWKWSGTLRVTLLLQIRLRGNAAFITLQEGEIRRCLAVALPASADLINAKTGPSGKKRISNRKVSVLCQSRRFLLSHLHVSGSHFTSP